MATPSIFSSTTYVTACPGSSLRTRRSNSRSSASLEVLSIDSIGLRGLDRRDPFVGLPPARVADLRRRREFAGGLGFFFERGDHGVGQRGEDEQKADDEQQQIEGIARLRGRWIRHTFIVQEDGNPRNHTKKHEKDRGATAVF